MEKKREFLVQAIAAIPEYFWNTVASTSGKYHPSWAVTKGGLARHVKMAIEIAIEMFEAYPELTTIDKEDIIIALILHDTGKPGIINPKGSFQDHALYPRPYFEKIRAATGLASRDYDRIMILIETHMGIWGANPPEKYIPKRKPNYRISPAEIVHLADYISSRRKLEVLFADGEEMLK